MVILKETYIGTVIKYIQSLDNKELLRMKENYKDPEIIKPKDKVKYACRTIGFKGSVYEVTGEILGKDGCCDCYYTMWHGMFLILLAYAELD